MYLYVHHENETLMGAKESAIIAISNSPTPELVQKMGPKGALIRFRQQTQVRPPPDDAEEDVYLDLTGISPPARNQIDPESSTNESPVTPTEAIQEPRTMYSDTTDYISTMPDEIKLNILKHLLIARKPITNPGREKGLEQLFTFSETFSTTNAENSGIETSILRTSKDFCRIGLDVLYRENTLASSEFLLSRRGYWLELPPDEMRNWLCQNATTYDTAGSKITLQRSDMVSKISLQSANVDDLEQMKAGIAPFRIGGGMLGFIQSLAFMKCKLKELTFAYDERCLMAKRKFELETRVSTPRTVIEYRGAFDVGKIVVCGVSAPASTKDGSTMEVRHPPIADALLAWMEDQNIGADSIKFCGRYTADFELSHRGAWRKVDTYKFINNRLMVHWDHTR